MQRAPASRPSARGVGYVLYIIVVSLSVEIYACSLERDLALCAAQPYMWLIHFDARTNSSV